MPTLNKFIEKKVLNIVGIARMEQMPADGERLTFINDRQRKVKERIREHGMWYNGDSDELLNFYTHLQNISGNFDPLLERNKRNYYWSVSSTENDIKRTHSGQYKNIVDTLCAIVGTPDVVAGNTKLGTGTANSVNKALKDILTDEGHGYDFWADVYMTEQLPMTAVEGWGCYKIIWDKYISEQPIPIYYRAENVDFIYKYNRIIGVIFKDYYTDGKKKYLITETRYRKNKDLVCQKEIFEIYAEEDDAVLKEIKFKDVPAFRDVEPVITIKNYRGLMATPCIWYKDSTDDSPGRSLLAGKLDLFDDLDQALSQDANSIRMSTPVEYFDNRYLERDKKGLPIQPKRYDRKYVLYKGAADNEGNPLTNGQPVTVTQSQINFAAYSTEALNILVQIVNGIISPATLGIDIAKKDNADAQREKEKITVFTRNYLVKCEQRILVNLFNELLCAKELMDKGEITVDDYEITLTFPEFADDSFENKISLLGEQLDKGNISPTMYLSKLYNGKLTQSQYDKELKYLEEAHKPEKEEEVSDYDTVPEGGNENEPKVQEDSSSDSGDLSKIFGQMSK